MEESARGHHVDGHSWPPPHCRHLLERHLTLGEGQIKKVLYQRPAPPHAGGGPNQKGPFSTSGVRFTKPKEVFEIVAKPKRSLLQRWFDKVFSDTVVGHGCQPLPAKTSLLSETHPCLGPTSHWRGGAINKVLFQLPVSYHRDLFRPDLTLERGQSIRSFFNFRSPTTETCLGPSSRWRGGGNR